MVGADGLDLLAWDAGFWYDQVPMQVVSTDPTDGSVVPLPFTTLTVNLNEAADPGSVGTDDLIFNQGEVVGAEAAPDGLSVQYTLAGISAEGTLTLDMPFGALADGFGNPSTAYSGSFVLDFGTVAYPTPLEAKAPAGGLVYDPSVSGVVGFVGDTDSFTIDLDAGQTIGVIVVPDANLQPQIQVSGPSGLLAGPLDSPGQGIDAVMQPVAAAEAGTYTITVGGASDTTGAYTVQIILNAAVEEEEHGGVANDTLDAAQDIESSFIDLDGSAQRGAVVGALPLTDPEVVFSELLDADPGWATEGQWQFGVPTGQGGWDDGYPDPTSGHTGENVYGVNLDGDYDTAFGGPYYLTTNAIDCTGYSDVHLDFWRYLNSDYPGYVDSTIDVSSDGVHWVNVYKNSDEVIDGEWTEYNYDISGVADNQSTVYVRWGYNVVSHWGVWSMSGWNVDDVQLTGRPLAPPDYYSFQLAAGESATVALASGSWGGLEIYDSGGVLQAMGLPGARLTSVVNNFVAPADGTYYAAVAGAAAPYSLVVTRNADFDTEPNGTIADAQDITGESAALGHVKGGDLGAPASLETRSGPGDETYRWDDGTHENSLGLTWGATSSG